MKIDEQQIDPPFITVTGADEQTDIDMLQKLNAEIGFLYTETPEGRNRYPRLEWIIEASKQVPRAAIHICGSAARDKLWGGYLDELVEHAQRIQINGILDIGYVYGICGKFRDKTIITQHKRENESLVIVGSSNHALLVDASGGRGISPEFWTHPITQKPVGFAGGIGPDNIALELKRIQRVADGSWWIDMEGQLRVDNWFSVDRARECVNLFHQFITKVPHGIRVHPCSSVVEP